jgi:hypothetical protein
MAISVDTTTLTTVISELVDLSMDGQFQDSDQQQFMALAKRLRGTLLNLLSARFNNGTPQVLAANDALTQVNNQVQTLTGNVAATANAIAQLTALVSQLDGLLSLGATVVSFV